MSSGSVQLTVEANKALVLRWFNEVWNQGRRETIQELFAAEGVLHDGAKVYRGPAEFSEFHDALRSQFSKFSIQPIISLAEADLACVHWSADFVQTATRKTVHVTGTSVVRIRNGQFVEAWQNWDAAGLAAQLASD